MPAESPTKWQVQAYRFGVRRVESAVALGDPLLRADGGRRRGTIAVLLSVVLTVVLVAVFLIYGFIRPDPSIGSAKVVIDDDTGQAYVAQNGRLYQALNLTSALLAAGRTQQTGTAGGASAPEKKSVSSSTIAHEPRGQTIGIPGAPSTLPGSGDLITSDWAVCDDTEHDSALPPSSPPTVTTTAILGAVPTTAGAVGARGGLLVTPDGGRTTYLLWSGRRSRIEIDDSAIDFAFGFNKPNPRPISVGLLDAIPAAAAITAPTLDLSGSPAASVSALGVPPGSVFAVDRAKSKSSLYVALPAGKQQVAPLVADLIRAEQGPLARIPYVAPHLAEQVPIITTAIPTSHYPSHRLTIHDVSADPVLCVQRSGTGMSSVTLLARRATPLPAGAKPVPVEPRTALTADRVYVRPGHGAVYQQGTASQPAGTGALSVVTDQGVRYPVPTPAALVSLGLGKNVRHVPPELLQLLPVGPVLDPVAAARFYPRTGSPPRSLPTPTAGPQG